MRQVRGDLRRESFVAVAYDRRDAFHAGRARRGALP